MDIDVFHSSLGPIDWLDPKYKHHDMNWRRSPGMLGSKETSSESPIGS